MTDFLKLEAALTCLKNNFLFGGRKNKSELSCVFSTATTFIAPRA